MKYYGMEMIHMSQDIVFYKTFLKTPLKAPERKMDIQKEHFEKV